MFSEMNYEGRSNKKSQMTFKTAEHQEIKLNI